MIIESSGSCLVDYKGRKLLDFASGSFNVNLGYSCKAILQAINSQLETLPYLHPMLSCKSRSELADVLVDASSGDFQKVYICAGGSEAVSAAIQFAKQYTGKYGLMCLTRGFHGSTALSDAEYKGSHEVYKIATPYCFRCPQNKALETCEYACSDNAVEAILSLKDRLAAIFLEPIIGINGVIPLPDTFLRDVRRVTRENGILVVYDEILTGAGRTGEMFAYQGSGTLPDILCVGKGINSGYLPIGAVMVSKEISHSLDGNPIELGGTNVAHPVVCASAAAGIRVIGKKGFLESVRDKGKVLLTQCKAMVSDMPDLVADVRGRGLLVGIELVERGRPIEGDNMNIISGMLMESGVLLHLDPELNVLPLAPPLNIEMNHLERGVQVIRSCLERYRVWRKISS